MTSSKALLPNTLNDLLRRHDVWRGRSQSFIRQASVNTGFDSLNSALLNKGWPRGCLIELIQGHYGGQWFVLAHALKKMMEEGAVVLLNPPAEPYALALRQAQLDLDALLVVRVQNKADFIACFTELARTKACSMLLAWQPKQALSYTELRKCQLSSLDNQALSFLFRHTMAVKQSSPASLRLSVSIRDRYLEFMFVKQRGALPGAKVHLPLPDDWFALLGYHALDKQVGENLYQCDEAVTWVKSKHAANLIHLHPRQQVGQRVFNVSERG